jgi:hypothetical protein
MTLRFPQVRESWQFVGMVSRDSASVMVKMSDVSASIL